jgi:hypothetical protein
MTVGKLSGGLQVKKESQFLATYMKFFICFIIAAAMHMSTIARRTAPIELN